jgi:hypothetical protein
MLLKWQLFSERTITFLSFWNYATNHLWMWQQHTRKAFQSHYSEYIDSITQKIICYASRRLFPSRCKTWECPSLWRYDKDRGRGSCPWNPKSATIHAIRCHMMVSRAWDIIGKSVL